MAESSVKWYGKQVMQAVEDSLPDGLFEAGEQFVRTAAGKTPRRRGDLAKSGYVSTVGRSTYRSKNIHRREVKVKKKSEMVAGFAAFYALFQEFGTKKMAAKPFLRPTLDEMKGQLGNTIVGKMRNKFK